MESVKCLILGGGPAGFTAAIYASRANLSPVLYEGIQPGGQLTTTTVIENFPGFPDGVDANTLMENMRQQAKNFGADIRQGTATSVDLSKRPFKVVIDAETEIEAESLIIATGAQAKYLGLPSEEKFKGAGVSGCATCDGFFYRKRTVAVVGGGDTACEDALYLAGLAKKVYMIVRRDVFRASKIMQQKVLSTENIKVLWNCNTQEVLGDAMGVTGARLLRKDGTVFDIAIDGFFLAIGHTPASELFAPYLERDAAGYLVTKPGTSETSIPGVFAAGDVKDPRYRQAITAAGSGCMAARDAEKFLLEQAN
ncbi:MAG: thioredoxin-disulfide reductase [Bacteroidales bacterium]|jgi:thioredoxin reductase (NADPH)|nr:thioredoxin-disulfide reductase [Bacteroidales bacterium]